MVLRSEFLAAEFHFFPLTREFAALKDDRVHDARHRNAGNEGIGGTERVTESSAFRQIVEVKKWVYSDSDPYEEASEDEL